jgi:hypothetical protein
MFNRKENIMEARAEKKEKISFFSESDMVIDKKGRKIIASEYPVWYNRQAVEEMQDDIRRDEYALKMGYVKEAQIPQVRERLNKIKEKLEGIEESIPKLTSKQKDDIAGAVEYLGNEIQEKMFTRSQMQKGLADSHEEARRMINPSITVTPIVAELASSCNVPIIDGKISRDGAAKIWKISRRALNEMSDCEHLRRD